MLKKSIYYILMFILILIMPLQVQAAAPNSTNEQLTTITVTKTIDHVFKNEIWNTLTKEQQQEALQKLIIYIANKLQINTPVIQWEEQSKDIAARYSPSQKAIILNSALDFSGENLVYFIVHEMRHAYQYTHINDGTEYANAMKENDMHYKSLASYGFEEYKNQPLEADAISYTDQFFQQYGPAASLPIALSYDIEETVQPAIAKQEFKHDARYYKAKESQLAKYDQIIFDQAQSGKEYALAKQEQQIQEAARTIKMQQYISDTMSAVITRSMKTYTYMPYTPTLLDYIYWNHFLIYGIALVFSLCLSSLIWQIYRYYQKQAWKKTYKQIKQRMYTCKYSTSLQEQISLIHNINRPAHVKLSVK